MTKPRRYLLTSLLLVLALGLVWHLMPGKLANPQAPHVNYGQALKQAHNGLPGAARVLYQQLARTDLSDTRRAALHAELPNYPSPRALKLADTDLQNPSALVREAAIQSVVGLVPGAQRSLLLGPVLEDREQAVRFAAANAMLGLSPDDQGLYFGPLQQVVEEYERTLKAQPENAEAQFQLARLYLHEGQLDEAQQSLEQQLVDKITPAAGSEFSANAIGRHCRF